MANEKEVTRRQSVLEKQADGGRADAGGTLSSRPLAGRLPAFLMPPLKASACATCGSSPY